MASAWAQVDIDRLIQEVDSISGTTTYQYDANGNLTQKTNGASTTTYSWNSDNRLIEVQTGSKTIRYGYDPQGRRIKRLKTEGSDKEETHYILDTQRAYHDIVIERTRRNSGPWQETSYLFTPDGIGAPLSQHNGTDTTQIYADGQGSTRLTLDGASAHTASYDAFGIRLNGSASTTHGYTGEQQDEDTGLIYLRARDYDPKTGRFISMDEHPGSQRIPLTLNKYLYGNADPVNFVDPSGYMSMAGSMSAIGGFAVVAMVALPTYNNLIVPNHSGLLVRPPIWHTMALMYFKALTVNVIDVMSISNKNYKDTGTHKHHTIPISMCGADDQEKSLIRSDDHSAIHAQIATIQVALEAAERLATKQTVGHRRHSVILQLAQTEDGRRTIVNALSQVYKSGGWWDIGSDPIGVVFNTEKGPYISGAKTSLGNKRGVCVRNK